MAADVTMLERGGTEEGRKEMARKEVARLHQF